MVFERDVSLVFLFDVVLAAGAQRLSILDEEAALLLEQGRFGKPHAVRLPHKWLLLLGWSLQPSQRLIFERLRNVRLRRLELGDFSHA